MSLIDIKNELQKIALEPTPECRKKVHALIDGLMPVYWLNHPLKANAIVSRCRRGVVPLTADQFGCKPAELVKEDQRASLVNESVFYAAGCDDGKKMEYADFIAMIETSKLHREGHPRGREKLTVSHWHVKRDIKMALICHPNVFVEARKDDPLSDMQRNYTILLDRFPDRDIVGEFDQLVEYISGQFAKYVPEGENHLYMVSAYFAHCIFESAEGIIYPSVQAKGHLGFNVAIRPDVKEDALGFIDAQECVLYKYNDYLPVSADTYSDEQVCTYLGVPKIEMLPWIE